MANRSYAPEDLVNLPVQDADDALVLARQLLTAAEHEQQTPVGEGPLGSSLLTLLQALTTRHDELEAVIAPLPRRPRTVRAADLVEDNAVGALVDWLRAFLRLPEAAPERARAQAIVDAFLGGGNLEFLRERPAREYVQVEARLGELRQRNLLPEIEALGGRPFLDHLLAAHAEYGVAVGATAVPAAEPPAQVRERRDALLQVIRRYVVRVSALGDPEDAAATRRAAALLRPLVEWDAAATRGRAAGAREERAAAAGGEKPDED